MINSDSLEKFGVINQVPVSNNAEVPPCFCKVDEVPTVIGGVLGVDWIFQKVENVRNMGNFNFSQDPCSNVLSSR